MKTIKYILILIILLPFSFCSKGDDGGGTSTPPVVTTPTPPSVPNPGKSSLTAPSNNEVCYEGQNSTDQQSSVSFEWAASSDTDSYDLIITNQNSNQVQTIGGITGTSRSVTLDKGIAYRWNVVSKANDTSVTTRSDTWQFYLEGNGQQNHVPFVATIISPAAGSNIDSNNGRVTLDWEGNDVDENDTLSYTVYIDTVDGLQNPPSEQVGISESTYEVSVQSGTTYYWRIKTSDGVSSSYTIVYSFQVN